jgi:hypothetical protein
MHLFLKKRWTVQLTPKPESIKPGGNLFQLTGKMK